MFLYKQYCYSDINAVVNSIISDPSFNGIGVINSVTSNFGVITINYSVNQSVLNYSFTPPFCSSVGFDNSYSGISTVDAVFYGSTISAVFVLAWSIKVIKRVL